MDACRREPTLKLETALTRQSHVEDETSRAIGGLNLQEIGNRCKQLNRQAYRAKEPAERGAKLWVIIDHHNTCVEIQRSPCSRWDAGGIHAS